jgi:hypothetical protein
VAQLGARFHGMEEVIGSIPIRSTNQPNNLQAPSFPAWCQIFKHLTDTAPRLSTFASKATASGDVFTVFL